MSAIQHDGLRRLRRINRGALVSVGYAVNLLAFAADMLGQETATTVEVKRVIVTGSNIPTAEETGPNPVDTYRPSEASAAKLPCSICPALSTVADNEGSTLATIASSLMFWCPKRYGATPQLGKFSFLGVLMMSITFEPSEFITQMSSLPFVWE